LEQFLSHTVARGVLVGARISTLMVFAPFFGSGSIPPRVKAGLAFFLTLALYPSAPQPAVMTLSAWVSALIGEAVIGLVLGLLMAFVFEAIYMAGQITGFQLGLTMETAIDPTTHADSPVLNVFYQSVALLLFLELGMHEWMLRAIAASYRYLPIGAANFTGPGVKALIDSSSGMFWVGLQLASPILIVTFLVDLAMGFMSKAAPQFPVVFTAIPVKVLIGTTLIAIGIGFWPRILGDCFHRALLVTEQIWALAR
jgi:flagellar biosynthesis protein FliR